MIFSYENRLQYFYFLLSGFVASALIVLLYFSLQTTIHLQREQKLQILQKSLEFTKPPTTWNYSNSWQPIGPPALRHRIYSAYFDVRTGVFDDVDDDSDRFSYGSLRVFAILPLKMNDAITCHVRQQDFTVTLVQALDSRPMRDHHGTQFAAYSIMCPLHTRRDSTNVLLPLSVAISYPSNSFSRIRPSYVAISYPKHMEALLQKSKPQIAVCVEPLQQKQPDALWMAEFVEIYRLQGASRFYFYRGDASAEERSVLEHYRKLGLADVLEWNTAVYGEQLHDAGIAAQLNDCVYRAMVVDSYRYAVVVNLDEVVMPLKHNSIAEYLRNCDEGRTSAFVFRNVFFHKNDADDGFSVPQHVRNRLLYTQNKVRRTVEIWPAYMRSRCIVNTRAVVEMGQHQVFRAVAGYVESVVHHSVGLVFQYRDKCINCKAMLMVDYTARRYGSLLWDRVDEVCLQVFLTLDGVCPAA